MILAFLNSLFAAEVDSQVRTYLKCYQQLTNQRVPRSSTVIRDIQTRKTTGAKACISLIKSASLNDDLKISNKNEQSLIILKNLQNLHNSWFKLYNLNRETQDHGVTNVIDSNQMAYHYTAVLLNDKTKYSSVFSTNDSLWALREGHKENIFSNDKDIQGRRSKIDGTGMRKWQVGGIKDNIDDYGKTHFFKPRLVQFGRLIGFEKVDNHLYFERFHNGKTLSKTSLSKNVFPGVFGTTPYLILNLAQDNETTDGGYKLHRRFANNFFSDFLCRNLPAIEKRDIRPIKKSKITFKNKVSCMACHQTMDQLAGLTSNLEVFNAGEVHTNAYVFRAVYQHNITQKANYKHTDRDLNYFQKKHTAKLYFRDYLGKLVDIELEKPKDLGIALKGLKDPYLCTVNRYFDYLTGVSVDLNNFSSINKKSDLRNFLLKLTDDLQRNGDTLSILEKIFASKYYISSTEATENE